MPDSMSNTRTDESDPLKSETHYSTLVYLRCEDADVVGSIVEDLVSRIFLEHQDHLRHLDSSDLRADAEAN